GGAQIVRGHPALVAPAVVGSAGRAGGARRPARRAGRGAPQGGAPPVPPAVARAGGGRRRARTSCERGCRARPPGRGPLLVVSWRPVRGFVRATVAATTACPPVAHPSGAGADPVPHRASALAEAAQQPGQRVLGPGERAPVLL